MLTFYFWGCVIVIVIALAVSIYYLIKTWLLLRELDKDN